MTKTSYQFLYNTVVDSKFG
uniref:Uncharacterized protein n=1 Tax=Rhizophora mucronata TaxID=61149 RepID=A0A2P2PFX4_RHIMU